MIFDPQLMVTEIDIINSTVNAETYRGIAVLDLKGLDESGLFRQL